MPDVVDIKKEHVQARHSEDAAEVLHVVLVVDWCESMYVHTLYSCVTVSTCLLLLLCSSLLLTLQPCRLLTKHAVMSY